MFYIARCSECFERNVITSDYVYNVIDPYENIPIRCLNCGNEENYFTNDLQEAKMYQITICPYCTNHLAIEGNIDEMPEFIICPLCGNDIDSEELDFICEVIEPEDEEN